MDPTMACMTSLFYTTGGSGTLFQTRRFFASPCTSICTPAL
ncbi:MAG: hypothetical protein SFZ23_02810 [Planctomycetota bacterium]|nr:hypothetical protein [Planctomycetota bacterium]